MTPKQIRSKKASLLTKLVVAKNKVFGIEEALATLRRDCKHPGLITTNESTYQDSWKVYYCPDCGWFNG